MLVNTVMKEQHCPLLLQFPVQERGNRPSGELPKLQSYTCKLWNLLVRGDSLWNMLCKEWFVSLQWISLYAISVSCKDLGESLGFWHSWESLVPSCCCVSNFPSLLLLAGSWKGIAHPSSSSKVGFIFQTSVNLAKNNYWKNGGERS